MTGALEMDAAEAVALQAVAWLSATDDLLGVFLGTSGLAFEDLRARLADPEFLAAVLDFILMDDAWLLAFCSDAGLPTDRPLRARAALPGGMLPHWT